MSCHHERYVLASECALCRKSIEKRITALEAEIKVTGSLLKCRTNDLDQIQQGYDVCHANLTLHQDLVRQKDKQLKEAQALLKKEQKS